MRYIATKADIMNARKTIHRKGVRERETEASFAHVLKSGDAVLAGNDVDLVNEWHLSGSNACKIVSADAADELSERLRGQVDDVCGLRRLLRSCGRTG